MCICSRVPRSTYISSTIFFTCRDRMICEKQKVFTGACACRRLSRIATNHYLRYRGSTMLASQGVVKTAQKSVEAVSAVSACW